MGLTGLQLPAEWRPHQIQAPPGEQRETARHVAERWRIEQGRCCFSTNMTHLAEMIEEQDHNILFPSLDYVKPREPGTSSVELRRSEVQRFSIGKYLTCRDAIEPIKEVLRSHSVSMTGRKEQLLEKLAKLSATVFEENETNLDAYFSRNRFLRVQKGSGIQNIPFPLLEDLDLRNMILTMYTIRHLRGNTILEASHVNDTFDLLSLARALIEKEVSSSGVFLRVE